MKKMKCNFFVAVFCLFTFLSNISVFASENEIADCSFHIRFEYMSGGSVNEREFNVYISNAKQAYEVICVYGLDASGTAKVIYPVVFATDGNLLDASIKVYKRDSGTTGYGLYFDANLKDNESGYRSSGKLKGCTIPLSVSDDRRLDSVPEVTLPCLKYSGSKALGWGTAIEYALNEYEKGGNTFEGNPNYYDPNKYESDLSGIGYLQNVTFHTNYIDGIDRENTSTYITYDSLTNTGFDITQSGANVSLYTVPRFAYAPTLTDYLKNTPTVEYGDMEYRMSTPGSDLRIDFSEMELRSIYDTSEYVAKACWGTPVILKLQYWLRVEYDSPNGNKCGGWVRIADDDNTAAETNKRTETFDPDGKKTTDGGYSDGTSTSDKTGHGQTEEEASNNETDSITTGGNDGYNDVSLTWFLDQLEALKNSLGQFPQLVSTVFGWLPAPVITLIGVGIAIVIIVSLIKAVRG